MEEFTGSRESAAHNDRSAHPYLQGNFYPQSNELHLVPCSYTGTIPDCLIGGQYIRNGPNPIFPPKDNERYHWFDGDGMLHGVFFFKSKNSNKIEPRYTNKFVKTDVYTASRHWRQTLLPSIASLIDPLTSNFAIIKSVIEAGFLAFLSGSIRLSVANTSVIYHDRRVMALCESGPPIEITSPELETLDWARFKYRGESLGMPGSACEWVTAHPKIDPINGDLIMFGYDIFQFKNPFIRYSVIGHDGRHKSWQVPVYLTSKTPKMMHDFACTQTHSIIIDCPLTMSPFSILSSRPMLHFDRDMPMKFGIIPRLYGMKTLPAPKWFICEESCMIFHSANAWDELDEDGKVVAICLVVCRFKGAKLVLAAGGIDLGEYPTESDVVHLYYYRYFVSGNKSKD